MVSKNEALIFNFSREKKLPQKLCFLDQKLLSMFSIYDVKGPCHTQTSLTLGPLADKLISTCSNVSKKRDFHLLIIIPSPDDRVTED